MGESGSRWGRAQAVTLWAAGVARGANTVVTGAGAGAVLVRAPPRGWVVAGGRLLSPTPQAS